MIINVTLTAELIERSCETGFLIEETRVTEGLPQGARLVSVSADLLGDHSGRSITFSFECDGPVGAIEDRIIEME